MPKQVSPEKPNPKPNTLLEDQGLAGREDPKPNKTPPPSYTDTFLELKGYNLNKVHGLAGRQDPTPTTLLEDQELAGDEFVATKSTWERIVYLFTHCKFWKTNLEQLRRQENLRQLASNNRMANNTTGVYENLKF